MKPTKVGFVCVDAVSNRPFRVKLTPMRRMTPLQPIHGLQRFLKMVLERYVIIKGKRLATLFKA
ncbi:hypothetical protein [Nostoc sp. UHCC 0302]|uniref:hypothetical protein n=1 Tax=Nostoc sp. UHCC 0302 TaxID=3134896 RepID=UPI00311C9656